MGSKASVNTSLTESLVFACPNLEVGEKIRQDLVYKFSRCWFFLYKDSAELYVTTEWGGKIDPETLKALQDRASVVNAENVHPEIKDDATPKAKEILTI